MEVKSSTSKPVTGSQGMSSAKTSTESAKKSTAVNTAPKDSYVAPSSNGSQAGSTAAPPAANGSTPPLRQPLTSGLTDSAQPATTPGTTSHTVQPGESIGSISQDLATQALESQGMQPGSPEYQAAWNRASTQIASDIKQMNYGDPNAATSIQPGQELTVPDFSKPAASPEPASNAPSSSPDAVNPGQTPPGASGVEGTTDPTTNTQNKTLDQWKAEAAAAGMPLKDYVCQELGIDPRDCDIMATAGFCETRQLGVEGVGLCAQSVLNTTMSSDPYFTRKYPTVEAAAARFAKPGTYGNDRIGYMNDTLNGETRQSGDAALLEQGRDYAWRAAAGYEVGDPTLFLNDKDAEWVKGLAPGRTMEGALENAQKSYDYKCEFEGNPRAATNDAASYEAQLRRDGYQRAADSLIYFEANGYAFVSQTQVGPYINH
ncbi:MAG: LysM peptidoglycan-binding domain-containing protein [Deltaproteobacteria bacterium]|nr:LysM peptidoglycan-binding domain-containing protein [Deltaproteobacteria bacterium]